MFEWKKKSFRRCVKQSEASKVLGCWHFFFFADWFSLICQVGHEVTNNKVIVEGAEEQESLFKVLQLCDLFSFVSFLFPVKSLHLAVKIQDFFFLFYTWTISIYFSNVWTKLYAMLIKKKKRETVIQQHNEKLSFQVCLCNKCPDYGTKQEIIQSHTRTHKITAILYCKKTKQKNPTTTATYFIKYIKSPLRMLENITKNKITFKQIWKIINRILWNSVFIAMCPSVCIVQPTTDCKSMSVSSQNLSGWAASVLMCCLTTSEPTCARSFDSHLVVKPCFGIVCLTVCWTFQWSIRIHESTEEHEGHFH